jgi:hypothetical protein
LNGWTSYRERLRGRFYNLRLKWAWVVLAYGGVAVCLGGLVTVLPCFILFALATGHGTFGEKLIQAYVAYQTMRLFFLGTTIADAALCVVGFRQLRRIASDPRSTPEP